MSNRIEDLEGEVWKPYVNDILHENQKFEISNYGRVKSLNKAKPSILKGYVNNGYLTFSIRKKNNKRTLCYFHRAVAEMFLPKENEDLKMVIHLDYDSLNNHVDNLKWVTYKEAEIHANQNPSGSKLDKIMKYWNNAKGSDRVFANKLNETQVLKIKKMVNDPNRKTRMKLIAKQFGVGVEQLYRIKNGESWGWVTEDYMKYGKEGKPFVSKEFIESIKK